MGDTATGERAAAPARPAVPGAAASPAPGTESVSVPVRLAAVFLPAALPREGRIALWDPSDGPLPTPGGEVERTE
jgi:hypothetical protein